MEHKVYVVSVFTAAGVGGNPAPIVLDGTGMTDSDMQDVARDHASESAFVLPAPKGSKYDFSLRFWVPEHEMEMCGHATVGTVWLMDRLGLLHKDQLSIWTQSGPVTARIADRTSSDTCVEVSLPHGRVEAVDAGDIVDDILSVLRVTPDDLTAYPIQNSCTSRTKTLIPLKNVAALEKLKPEFSLVEKLCEKLDSTGLYPYAVVDEENQIFEARQFPKSSGYPEDPATGIAAAALAYGLLANRLVKDVRSAVIVRQGRMMNCPSEISVRFQTQHSGDVTGCWLGGAARLVDEA